MAYLTIFGYYWDNFLGSWQRFSSKKKYKPKIEVLRQLFLVFYHWNILKIPKIGYRNQIASPSFSSDHLTNFET